MVRLETGAWQCGACGWETRTKTRLWEHVEAMHVSSAGHTCELCLRVCPSRNAYKVHKSRYHKNTE